MKTKISYRPEIDGLRALAVGAVIIYHARIYLGEIFYFRGIFRCRYFFCDLYI